MSFLLLLLYLTASYVRPSEQLLGLADVHVILAIAVFALPAAFLSFLTAGNMTAARIPHVYLVAAFLAVVTVSPIIARGWFGGGWLALDQFFTSVAVLLLIVLNVSTVRRLAVTSALIAVLSLFLAGESVLAIHAGYRPEALTITQRVERTDEFGFLEETVVRARSLGYLNDPNDLAQALVAAVPLLWPFWGRRRSIRNFFVVLLPTAALIYGVYLTRSRGGMLALAVMAALRARESMARWRNSGPLLIALALAAAMLAGGFSGGRAFAASDESVSGRIDAWAAGLAMLKTHPFFGVGYGAFNDYHELSAHNSFVLCFAELGIAGYMIWVALLLSCHSSLARIRSASPENPALARWARAIMFALYGFVCSGFFLSRTYSPTLYLILGLSIAAAAIAKAEGCRVSVPFRSLVTRTAAGAAVSIMLVYAIARLHTMAVL